CGSCLLAGDLADGGRQCRLGAGRPSGPEGHSRGQSAGSAGGRRAGASTRQPVGPRANLVVTKSGGTTGRWAAEPRMASAGGAVAERRMDARGVGRGSIEVDG